MINVLYEAHFRLDGSLLASFLMFLIIPFIPRKTGMMPKDRRIMLIIQVFGMIMTGFMVLVFLSNDIDLYNTCVKAYRSGDYEIVEGYVENYVPMPKEGHALESFNVGDVYFEYSENSAVCGYSQTEPYGGVIRNGQYLKIGYVYHPSYGNIIVYIEENTRLSRFSALAK